MFDLFRSRDKLVKIVLTGLLVLVGLSMLVYLIPSYNTPFGNSADPVLAEVGNFRITASDAMRQFQAQPNAAQLPADLYELYFPEFLENMILQRAAVVKAEQMGLEITDQELLVGMEANFPDYFQDGKVINMDEFTAVLASIGLTPQTALDAMRSQLLLTKVQDVVLETAVVTPQEVERAFRDKYERATVKYLAFDAANLRDQVEITEDEARERFEREKALYNEPVKNTFRVAVLDQFLMESNVKVTEQDLRNTYNATLDNYRVDEEVQARHILLDDEDEAEDIREQLENGADFAELAREHSKDTGTAESGGDLGSLTRGTLTAGFEAVEEAAFSLPVGQISDVIQSPVGYHIVEVTDRSPARVQTFEEVRSLLEDETRANVIAQQMDAATNEIREAFLNDPDNIRKVVDKYGGELVQVVESAAGDPIPTLGVSPEIDMALQGLQPGGVTQVLALPADRYAVARLDERIESRPSTFEEVEAQVRDKIFAEKSSNVAAELAEKAAERVRAGEDLEKVAKDMDASFTVSNSFSRQDNIDGLGPSAYMEDAFTGKVGDILGPLLIQNRNVVAEVTAKQEADMTTLDFERDELVLQLKQAKAEELNMLWQDSILKELMASGDVVRNDANIQLALSQFR